MFLRVSDRTTLRGLARDVRACTQGHAPRPRPESLSHVLFRTLDSYLLSKDTTSSEKLKITRDAVNLKSDT